MAWTIDTNFGSTHTASEAFTPFDTGGGNRILSVGSGVTYRDDIDELDVSLSCDLASTVVSSQSGGLEGSEGLYLIARRQPDGSFYTGAIALYGNNQGPNVVGMKIFKYDGTLDTFTVISEIKSGSLLNPLISGTTPGQFITELSKFEFIASGSSLEARILNNLGQVIVSINGVDGDISSSGNPGLGGFLTFVETNNVSTYYIDNLQIDLI